ncbi:MAG TPA: glycosyltransferase family 2 protein [Candidatus Saccharimonadales bacterium]|nr:glycosyltransferase family 2 protein [Candidatus Saccharimonadales bacterium]
MANTSIEPTVAYVVVAWNNQELLDDCILSINQQDYEGRKKIILVDNASSDDTVEYITKTYPEVEIIAEKDNHGFAKGNNIGIDRALEDGGVAYVVLLNTDARLDSNWTSCLTAAAQLRPLTATMQSVTLDYYDPGIIDSSHIYISKFGQGTQGSWRQPIAYGNDVAPQKVFGCNAAAMLITRKFIEAQPFRDLFDETMFMYLEDVDLAARATVMGWDNFVVPGTRAHHMGSVSSSKKDPSFSIYMSFRNNTGLLIKNLPLMLLLKVLVRMPRADRASILHLKRIGKDKAVWPLIKGRLTSVLYVPIFIYKRMKLKSHRRVDKDYLWQLMHHGF